MKLFHLTAYSFMVLGIGLFMSCEKQKQIESSDKAYIHEKSGIALTGAQVIPATTSPATGTLWVSYNERSQLLNYELVWGGLRDTIREINIYEAPIGYTTIVAPTQKLSAFNATNLRANQAAYPFLGGKYVGGAMIDGVVFTKDKLLNHRYYIQILTKQFPNGEARAQIKFK